MMVGAKMNIRGGPQPRVARGARLRAAERQKAEISVSYNQQKSSGAKKTVNAHRRPDAGALNVVKSQLVELSDSETA
jgi:hypothetical protein